jgi:hypothetical protein
MKTCLIAADQHREANVVARSLVCVRFTEEWGLTDFYPQQASSNLLIANDEVMTARLVGIHGSFVCVRSTERWTSADLSTVVVRKALSLLREVFDPLSA